MVNTSEAGVAPARIVASPAHWLGAGLSVALIGAIGVWGYQLTQRDVTVIPVVAALDGPFKVLPESAGGRQADHQGFAVNAVPGQGGATPSADEVALAPGEVRLTTEDLPLAQMKPVAREDVSPVEELAFVSTTQEGLDRLNEMAAQVAANTPLTADQVAAAQAALKLDATRGTVGEGAEFASAVITTASAATAPQRVAQFTGGVARSLRPLARPVSLRRPVIAPAAPAQVVPAAVVSRPQSSLPASPEAATPVLAPIDVDPASLPVGTQLVQVMALASPEAARTQWDKLSSRFGVLFSDKRRVIQETQSNGRTFYRLRVLGFAGLADARRFCAVIQAGQTDCIPVSHN